MHPTMVCRIACALIAGVLISGCERPIRTPPQVSLTPAEGAPSKVTVAAAANLKFAFDSIAAEFEKQHADIDVEVTYGSSGNFFAQLSQQAPFDLFLSADTEYPTKLVEQGLAPQDSYFVYAIGRLVLWVPTSSPLEIEELGLAALTEPSVQKIAIANPEVAPYGEAAEAALKQAGVYDAVKDRLVRGDNIAQTAQFVESGAADAGFLALSLALAPELKDKGRYFEVPADAHEPIEQAGVVLSWAKHAEAANRLRSFLTGSEGQKLLAKFGYRAPGE
jgi:molybdate transport system substrate-binding protein